MRFFSFIFFLVLLGRPALALAEEAFDVGFLKLLHYEKKGGAYVSLVENKEFFLSPLGQSDPKAEYAAAVTAFNEENNLKKCVFPARFIYLKRRGVVSGTLDKCADYQKFLKDVQPNRVTMLFTNAYMNNPSSMFGHTLFRIDTAREGGQLLAHGANFGADTGDESGVLYALKGVWGGYYGRFGIRPYYDVINLYNNIENRDIWEYGLNFSDDELELFVAHLWEMREAKIRYYYATKNCSYVLLLMLEAAKPELELADNAGVYTLPLDTIKAVNDVAGLVTETRYRPSRQSKLKHRAEQMNKAQLAVLSDIIKKDKIALDTLKEEEKADVLETAYQYEQYRYIEERTDLAVYRKKSFKLLKERSGLRLQKQYFDDLKEGKNPVLAHGAAQAGGSLGAKNGKFFEEVLFRPLYNSLLEDSFGLLKGAEISAFETKMRRYEKENKFVLDEFKLLGIRSLVPNDVMFSPLSYDFLSGFKRVYDVKNKKEHTAFQLSLGAGKSFELMKNLQVYAMSVPNVSYGGGLDDNGFAGFGLRGGVYYNNGVIRAHLRATENLATNYVARGETYEAEVGVGLTRRVTLYGGYRLFDGKSGNDEEVGVGLRFNF